MQTHQSTTVYGFSVHDEDRQRQMHLGVHRTDTLPDRNDSINE